MSIIDKIKVREGTHEVVEEDIRKKQQRWPNAYAMGTRRLGEAITVNAILESWRRSFNQSMTKKPLTGDELKSVLENRDNECRHQARVDAETPQDRRDGMTRAQLLDEYDDKLPAWVRGDEEYFEYEIRTRDAASGTVEVVRKEPE